MSKQRLLVKFNSLRMNELHRAMQKNNAEAVEYLVKKGVDIMNTIDGGQTPLHLAVSLDYVLIIPRLFTNKSREEARNLIDRRTVDTGMTVLLLAAKKNSDANVRCLLSRGANFEIRDKENRQAKHLTTSQNILSLIHSIELIFKHTLASDSNILLEKLKLCSDGYLDPLAYARNSQGFTPLQLAMNKNHLDAVATIIDWRIDRLSRDLWQAGAQIDNLMRHSKATRLCSSNLDAFCHENSESTLDLRKVKEEVVNLLRNAYEFLEAYKQGRDCSLENQTLLIIVEESLEFFGSWKNSKFIENKRVDSLLRKGPLFAAEMIKLSIVAPIQFFMESVYTTELLDAAKRDDLDKVEQCLTGHPNMDARDTEDWTALHYALNHHNMKMFKLLLTLGADPTSVSLMNGETFLHFLSRCKTALLQPVDEVDVLKTLSSHVSGDGVNARAFRDGRSTALHLAVKEGNLSLVQLLLARGAIYCAKDAHDKTPMDYCDSENSALLHLKTVDRLFAQVRDNKTEDSMQVIREARENALLAYCGARDDEGRTLVQVLEIKRCYDAADEIRELLHNVKLRYRLETLNSHTFS